MVPHYSFWLLLITVIHCLVLPTAVNAELAFVRPNSSVSCASPQQRPCMTFNEYAQQVNQYFVDNTTFLFLPGTHELDVQLDLEGLSNVSLIPLSEGISESDAVQIFISPSVNITWNTCENIEVSGFTCILSGELGEATIFSDDLMSAELVFHNTSAVLSNLTLAGNGTRLFVFARASSDLQISNLMADGIKAPILHASESAIKFYGHSTFCNNNITVNVHVVSTISTGLIQLDHGSSCYINGTISFTQNSIILYALNAPFSGGTAISVFGSSTLVVGGTASFIRNRVIIASVGHNDLFIYGGALLADTESKVIFEEFSNISFIENSAEFGGGAISILGSNLTMYGRALFEGNSAKYGGAIYAKAFLSNANNNIIELRDVHFERNTARFTGGAIYAVDTQISMTGTLYFVKNSAKTGGAIAFGYGLKSLNKLLLIEPLVANFTENSANMSGGVIFFDDINTPIGYLCTNYSVLNFDG